MQLVGEGGMIELEIPSALGYGDRGLPPRFPAAQRCRFLVELLKIKRRAAAVLFSRIF